MNTGGVLVANGMTIADLGLKVSGGLSILDGGFYINAGGLTILSNGLQVTGGVSIVEGGAIVTGGLTVNGDTWFSVQPTVSSDKRLKTNIRSLEDSMQKVSQLRGVYFNWIQDEPSGMRFDNDTHVGVLAQDVQAVLPEIVGPSGDKQGQYLGVKYLELIPVLVEAVKELDDRRKRASVVRTPQKATAAAMKSVPVAAAPSPRDSSCADLFRVMDSLHTRIESLERRNIALSGDIASMRERDKAR